ncbi:hypothetical protein B0H13DRAFT_1857568 [Mycena leptocephala]|nr:hypothetical protein B0H13DRAFT_1857568 [Mycena leptocephala]
MLLKFLFSYVLHVTPPSTGLANLRVPERLPALLQHCCLRRQSGFDTIYSAPPLLDDSFESFTPVDTLALNSLRYGLISEDFLLAIINLHRILLASRVQCTDSARATPWPHPRSQIPRPVPWTSLCMTTAVKTSIGWFTISGLSFSQSSPPSPPSMNRIRPSAPAYAPSSLHWHVQYQCVPPASRAALLVSTAVDAMGIIPAARLRSPCTCSTLYAVAASAFGAPDTARSAPDTARSLHTRNEAGKVGYSRKVVAAEMNDHSSSRSLPWEGPAIVPSLSLDWMGCKSVALMGWENGYAVESKMDSGDSASFSTSQLPPGSLSPRFSALPCSALPNVTELAVASLASRRPRSRFHPVQHRRPVFALAMLVDTKLESVSGGCTPSAPRDGGPHCPHLDANVRGSSRSARCARPVPLHSDPSRHPPHLRVLHASSQCFYAIVRAPFANTITLRGRIPFRLAAAPPRLAACSLPSPAPRMYLPRPLRVDPGSIVPNRQTISMGGSPRTLPPVPRPPGAFLSSSRALDSERRVHTPSVMVRPPPTPISRTMRQVHAVHRYRGMHTGSSGTAPYPLQLPAVSVRTCLPEYVSHPPAPLLPSSRTSVITRRSIQIEGAEPQGVLLGSPVTLRLVFAASLAYEISVFSVTISRDGTKIRHIDYETKPVTFRDARTGHPTTRILDITSAPDHTSEVLLAGWHEVLVNGLVKTYNASPLGQVNPIDEDEFITFIRGLGTDHTTDQKKLARLINEWMTNSQKLMLGKRYLSSTALENIMLTIARFNDKKIAAADGLDAWTALLDEEKILRNLQVCRELYRHFGETA